VWSAARYVNPPMGMPLEALTDREGRQANTSFQKGEMLRQKYFPPNDGNLY